MVRGISKKGVPQAPGAEAADLLLGLHFSEDSKSSIHMLKLKTKATKQNKNKKQKKNKSEVCAQLKTCVSCFLLH